MKTEKYPEIMAPVGSYESLAAAIQAGADSVYFGVGSLNMRSRSSKNFSLEDLATITERCASQGIKTYLTVNTVVYDEEMEQLQVLLEKAKENKISAIIASDMAVIQLAKSLDLTIHMSTQTNISNIEAVKFYAAFADVMVLARELNLKQIHEICKAIKEQNICGPSGELVKIEIFVHGALCMAVSGKCYLSLDNMNYSANRGACLQICRRPYRVTDKDGGIELEVDNDYIMSPKDLMTLPFIDKIMQAGVSVLKIEGRGRSADYVKTLTGIYKQAVVAVHNKTFSQEKVKKWEEELKKVFNRGFWGGYYLGKRMGEWSEVYGSQATKKKTYAGKITNYFSQIKVAEVLLEASDISVGDEIMIVGPTTGVINQKITEIRVELKKVETAKKGNICSVPIDTFLRRSDKIYVITDSKELF
jgi:putative protease